MKPKEIEQFVKDADEVREVAESIINQITVISVDMCEKGDDVIYVVSQFELNDHVIMSDFEYGNCSEPSVLEAHPSKSYAIARYIELTQKAA